MYEGYFKLVYIATFLNLFIRTICCENGTCDVSIKIISEK